MFFGIVPTSSGVLRPFRGSYKHLGGSSYRYFLTRPYSLAVMRLNETNLGRRSSLKLMAGMAVAALVLPSPAPAEEQHMEITRIGSQPSAKGPADWFTGTVRIDAPFDRKDPARV